MYIFDLSYVIQEMFLRTHKKKSIAANKKEKVKSWSMNNKLFWGF